MDRTRSFLMLVVLVVAVMAAGCGDETCTCTMPDDACIIEEADSWQPPHGSDTTPKVDTDEPTSDTLDPSPDTATDDTTTTDTTLPDTTEPPDTNDDGSDTTTIGPLSLELSPTPPHMGVGTSASLSALAHWPSEEVTEVTLDATWSASPGGILTIAQPGEVTAVGPGEVTITASYQGHDAMHTFTVYPPEQYEARALWVNRWQYSSPEDVIEIMAGAASAGFNVIYFQVRGRFDAFYASDLEPWASELSGTLGEDPGWDPLALAISEAHGHGMELHAWINVFSYWSGSTTPQSAGVPHPLESHPEWVMVDEAGDPMPLASGEYLWASPGITALRSWNVAVAKALVESYPELDGIHLDRIRYPGTEWSYDAETLAAYEDALVDEPGLGFADFRRWQVDAMVAEYYAMLQEVAPQVVLSAAVAAKYQNVWDWSMVAIGYEDYLQDSRAWLEGGYLDVACPMAYWPFTDPKGLRTDFASIVDDWFVDVPWDRHVYMGMSGDYADFGEIAAEIAYVRDLGGEGTAIYHWADLVAYDYLDDLDAGPYTEPAVVPWMPWKSH